MLTLIAALAMTQSAIDHGVLIGLRDQQGSYRTLLVSQQGVAYVVKEHKHDVVKSNKQAVHALRRESENILFQGRPFKVGSEFRIAWMSQSGVGLEIDAARPGERPFTRLGRRVVRLVDIDKVVDVRLSEVLEQREKARLDEAAAYARSSSNAELSETDWGYVRSEGAWQFVGTVGAGVDRREFVVPGKPVTSGLWYTSEVAWRTVARSYPDATDFLAANNVPFAVVVTPSYIFVHEVSRTSLGRMVRKFPVKSETVVHYEFGAAGPLDSWHTYFRG
jgi:hypothetical protein